MADTLNYPQGVDSFDDVVDDVTTAQAVHVNNPHNQLELVETDMTKSIQRSQFSADAGAAAISQYEVVYVDSSNTVKIADADDINKMPVVAIAADGGIDAGTSQYMVTKGEVNWGGWSWTPGETLYASLTAGDITNDISGFTAGDVVQKVGYAISDTKIMFDPEKDVTVIA